MQEYQLIETNDTIEIPTRFPKKNSAVSDVPEPIKETPKKPEKKPVKKPVKKKKTTEQLATEIADFIKNSV